MKNEIQIFSLLTKYRNLLKEIQQLSWNITQFERRFPLETANQEDYPALLTSYEEFADNIFEVAKNFAKLIETKEQINEIKMNNIKKDANENSTH